MAKINSGTCLCKSVKLAAEGEPLRVVHCHCPSCRKATGAAFVTFVDFDLDKMTFSGATLKEYQSSPGVIRQFCGKCGSTLSFFGENLPGEIAVCIGVFDHPEEFTPDGQCNTKTALPWAQKMDDLPSAQAFTLDEEG